MKISTLAYLFISGSAGVGAAQDLPDGVLHVPLALRQLEDAESHLARRDASIFLDLADPEAGLYRTDIEVGSDHEKVRVQIDTRSRETWLMSPANEQCSYIINGSHSYYTFYHNYNDEDALDVATCDVTTFFYQNQSSSFTQLNSSFGVNYGDINFIGDNTWAHGYLATDTISVGGVTLSNATFGFANATDENWSSWGLGLSRSATGHADLLGQLKEQGSIKAAAYSLWLDDASTGQGSILLGGVDHAKYSGSLQTVPVVNGGQALTNASQFQIMLHGISLYQGNSSAEVVQCSLPAALSTTGSWLELPDQLLQPIIESVGEVWAKDGYFLVPCALDGGLSFDFSGVKVDVPFSSLMAGDEGYPDSCALGIRGGSDVVTIGGKVLTALYAVFDADNEEVALAKPVRNATSSSVEAISSEIPSAVRAASYSSTRFNSTVLTSRATFFSNALPSQAPSLEADFYITLNNYTESGTLTGLSVLPLMEDATATATRSQASGSSDALAASSASHASHTATSASASGSKSSSLAQNSAKQGSLASQTGATQSAATSRVNTDKQGSPTQSGAKDAKSSTLSASSSATGGQKNAAARTQCRRLVEMALCALLVML